MVFWIVFGASALLLYKFCFSSLIFVLKFIACFFKNIKNVLIEGIYDIESYVNGVGRFKDYGYYIYGGSFGNGKSQNMVKHANDLIRYYKKWYKVTVISNIYLKPIEGANYLPFMYFEDLFYKPVDGEIVIYVIDESGSLFFSRNYSTSSLNSETMQLVLNQVRKEDKCVLMSAQRHKQLDVVLRRICNQWFEVQKKWRFSFIEVYDGYDLEYGNPEDNIPVDRLVFYNSNKDRRLYNHKEFVNKLSSIDNAMNIENSGDVRVNVSINDTKKKRGRKKQTI